MKVFFLYFQNSFKKYFSSCKILFSKYVPKLLLLTDDTFQYPAGTA